MERAQVRLIEARLREPRRFIQVVTGPRQVGKTTAVLTAVERVGGPTVITSADEPMLRRDGWLAAQWAIARAEIARTGAAAGVLVIDEVQKLPVWSETVKRLWDEDSREGVPLHVVLLGSAPLLVARGLTESLAGRFEQIHLAHWSWPEMREAFGWDLERYLCYGGYPGAAPLVEDPERWRRYILDALVETTIARDVLLLNQVNKPALLRRLFELGARYSGQVLSYTKMLGQLQDAGNTTTLAHYLDLLSGAGMLTGLPKYAGDVARRRGSSPKFQVLNTALMTALSGVMLDEARRDRSYWGRLVESACGAHLANAAAAGDFALSYWRDGDDEVDFVITDGRRVATIEVKSGRADERHGGTEAFRARHRADRSFVVGADAIPLAEFLETPPRQWIGA